MPDISSPATLDFDASPAEPAELAELYRQAGWYVLPLEAYERALAGTFLSLSVRHGGCLVGYGRVVSDGGAYAWIHDLIVTPGFRGRGLGRRILTELVDRIRRAGIPYIGLFAARGRAGFYEKFGFLKRPEDAPGMFLYLAPE